MASGTVLVTGASTGIGEATALHLRELGFEPVAGVRSDEDAERLARSGLRTVKLDVTDAGRSRRSARRSARARSPGSSTTPASPWRRRSSSCRSTSCAGSSRST